MGREVRRVPADWEHPTNERDQLIPLKDSYNKRLADWEESEAKWNEGLRSDFRGGWEPRQGNELRMTFSDWDGEGPRQEDYMPDWPVEQRTHYQMYEDTTEGTPISPVFDSPEKLARWLADNNASAFGQQTATYEQWLGMIDEGYAVSAVFDGKSVRSGVEAMGDASYKRNHDWPDIIS